MATATMARPPPPPGPPPGKPSSKSGPSKPRPPPPPPSGSTPRRPPPPAGPPSHAVPGSKRPGSLAAKENHKHPRLALSLPKSLRDVTVFNKKGQVGQGTYGSVFKGEDSTTRGIYALKLINTEQEENGFPITAIREVKILKALENKNIVKLKEIVTSQENGQLPKSVYMVFEYMEFDLTGILETPSIRLTQDHIKSWSLQLLAGVHYMHTNQVIHRDLKASNLLINKQGELKIADFGLARSWNPDMRRLTNKVITLWYRPPELLLGCSAYSDKIDMWSVGCIIAEMFRRSGFLRGGDEATQLDLIFRTCGHPTLNEWPDIHKMCPLWPNFEPKSSDQLLPRRVKEALKSGVAHASWCTENAKELIDKLMIMNPKNRWSAKEAIGAEYFYEDPIVKQADQLNMKFSVDSVHEWEAREKHKQAVTKHTRPIP